VAQVKHLHLNHWFVMTRNKHVWGFSVLWALQRSASSHVGSLRLSECGVEK
jgi:hypothetical protein